MIVKSVEFKCDDSMHMKAIAVLIKKASAFNSRIWLTQEDVRRTPKVFWV